MIDPFESYKLYNALKLHFETGYDAVKYNFKSNVTPQSFFKRKIGVKDSGKLIPGHGGLMDRFDGYFLVIPFLYIFII